MNELVLIQVDVHQELCSRFFLFIINRAVMTRIIIASEDFITTTPL